MKKLISFFIAAALLALLTVTASAADLSTAITDVSGGTVPDGYLNENYIRNCSYPDVLSMEFDLTVNGPINNYATVFCFHNGDGNARFVFTLGGGMFYNNWAGSWFDAGVHEGISDNIFEPYIGSTVHVKIVIDYDKFELYLDDELAYDSNTLKSRNSANDAFYGEGIPDEFMTMASFICSTTNLDFGYNSWWANASLDATNAELSDFAIYFDGNLMAKYMIGGDPAATEFHTDEEYAPETTEVPETEPETVLETEPETEAPATNAPETDASEEEKSGCGAAVSAPAVILIITAVIGTAVRSKK